MAWQRTGLAAMTVGALLTHANRGSSLPPWPGLLLMAMAVLTVLVLAPRRYRRVLRSIGAGEATRSRRMVPGAALVVLVVVLGAGVAVLLG